jgi:flagellar protein FlgJ
MTIPPVARRSTLDATTPTPHAQLRAQAKALEGVFTEQLYKAMRETVPQGEGATDGGAGEEMFTGLMDQKLATDTPDQWRHGIGDALYRQLSRALPGDPAAVPPAPPAAPATATAAPSPEDPR